MESVKYDSLSETLIALFREITEAERTAVITEEFSNISNNDLHIIEAIGTDAPRSMSAVARDLSVTMGTLSIAANGLVKKSYVRRARSESDRRVVLLSLTKKGRRAYAHHKRFQEEMIRAVLKGLDAEEASSLVGALKNLRNFLSEFGK